MLHSNLVAKLVGWRVNFDVIAPSKARRILQGESPCREETSNGFCKGQPPTRIEPWAYGGVAGVSGSEQVSEERDSDMG